MTRLVYQSVIAAALKRELGGSHQAVKTTMKWTGVSEKTAKNWLAGSHGPAGEHLMQLLRHSDEVVSAVLVLCDRHEYRVAAELGEIRSALIRILSITDSIISSDAEHSRPQC